MGLVEVVLSFSFVSLFMFKNEMKVKEKWKVFC